VDRNDELTLREKREAMLSAFEKMPEEDQERIDNMINDLVRKMKLKNPMIQFSYESGVELVARLGQFLARGYSV
jgi:hypothetical protein